MTKEIIMAEKTVDMPDTQEGATQPEDTRTRERYVTPAVDIYEIPEGLVVIADVPGVTPDHFDVRVDNHILTIWGQAAHGLPSEPTYREYELVNYFRQFDLSAKVDESQIAADLKHGVLTLTLSKVADAQPRKIAVAGS
jgi:HSP20 family molecular chaperone IbpA